MTPSHTRSTRPDRVALGMRWLVLLVIHFGTLLSSVGGMTTHGIAAIAAVSQVSPASSDTEHGHVHVLEEFARTGAVHRDVADAGQFENTAHMVAMMVRE